MRRFVALIVGLLLILAPASVLAKSSHKGYSHDRGKEIVADQPLGWPVSISTSAYTSGSIESLPNMAVIRIVPYKPWWQVWGSVSATTTIKIAGLPADTDLHIYTKGYREHSIEHTSKQGTLSLTLATKPGVQLIIKTKPSTYHIRIGGSLFFPTKGGDCNTIGVWTETSKTCTLSGPVSQTISIDDDGITLNGNGKSMTGSASEDGVYTDQSNVTVKNLNISGFDRGIAFADSFLSIAPSGGTISSATTTNNVSQIVVDDIPNVAISNVNISGGTTGVRFADTPDLLFDTDGLTLVNSTVDTGDTGIFFAGIEGVTVSHSTIKNTPKGLAGTIDGTVTMTQNNFIANTADISGLTGTLILDTATDRGNFWSKNTTCTQVAGQPSHCANSYPAGGYSDATPWACKDGWTLTCPIGGGGGGGTGSTWAEVSTTTGTASVYSDQAMTVKIKTLPNGWVLKVLDNKSNPNKVEDPTDSMLGWVSASSIVTTGNQTELENKIEKLDDPVAREYTMISLLEHYFTNTDTNQSLYSSDDMDKTGTSSKISSLSANSFPLEVVLSIISEESGPTSGRTEPRATSTVVNTQYNNELVTYDGGYGLFQITTKGFHGAATNYSTNDERCSLFRYVLVNGAYDDEQLCKFYTNTYQGIASNLKDGLRVLAIKYASSKMVNGDENGKVIAAGAVWRYNGNSPDNPGDFKKDYLTRVGTRLAQLETNYGADYRSYLPNVSKLSDTEMQEYKDQFTNYIIGEIKSPAMLTAIDSSGRVTGLLVSGEKRDVPRSDYQNEKLILLNTADTYNFRVTGYTTGSYGLDITKYTNASSATILATSIQITSGVVHEYSIDWQNLTATKGVTVRIDQNGDGVFEKSITGGSTLTASQFAKSKEKNKTILCHRPPGNPSNSHTLYLPASALSAHLEHGDKLGECGDESDNKIEKDKDDNTKNNEKSEKHENENKKDKKVKKDK